MSTKCLIVEDHPIFAEALRASLRSALPEMEIVQACALSEAKATLYQDETFDLVLLDLWLPDTHGFEGLIELSNKSSGGTLRTTHLLGGRLPSATGRPRWTQSAKTLPSPLRGDAADFPVVTDWTNKGLEAFQAATKELDQLEERRLGYVAVTRAKQRLIASAHWWGPTQSKPRGPSTFLDEIREHCLAGPRRGRPLGAAAGGGAQPGPRRSRRRTCWPPEARSRPPRRTTYRRGARTIRA